MLNLLLAIAVVTAIHVGTMTLVGRLLGLRIMSVSYGAGPTLLRRRSLQLRAVPIASSVRFLHSVEDEAAEQDWPQAIDRSSLAAQLLIILSGCAMLLALAIGLAGAAASDAFLALPSQLLAGALSPLDRAQSLLGEVASTLQSSSLPTLLALVSAKCAALNLLPLPMLNGGAALAALAQSLGVKRLWPLAATRALLCVHAGLLALWGLALVAYVAGS